MTRPALLLAVLAALPLFSSGAEARRQREPDAQGHRPVGRPVPIVAGSSSVRVDAVGQVVTDFNAGQLKDRGQAAGASR